MRVFVIGGTGFLGSHLVPKLLGKGHDVAVLTRSKEKASSLKTIGIRGIVGDLLYPESFISNLPPQDVVIAAAMPKIVPGPVSRKRLRVLQEQTCVYFSTYIDCAEKLKCPLVLTMGASFHTIGDEVADENWSIERRGIARVGGLVEPLISEVMERGSPPLIQMLPGQIYGPGGLFRDFMYEWMKKGKFRVIGSGDNCIPRIHVEDCAEAYVLVIEEMPLGEKFIIADDWHCTVREFSDLMAENMDIARPKSVPRFLIRLVLGKLMYETVTMNCRVSNIHAKKLLGWNLKYPTCREGLPAAIIEIEREGR